MKNPDFDPNWLERFKMAITDEARTAAVCSKYSRTEHYRDALLYDIMEEAKQYQLQLELPAISDDATIDEICEQLEPYRRRLREAERAWKYIPPQLRWQMHMPGGVPPSDDTTFPDEPNGHPHA